METALCLSSTYLHLLPPSNSLRKEGCKLANIMLSKSDRVRFFFTSILELALSYLLCPQVWTLKQVVLDYGDTLG